MSRKGLERGSEKDQRISRGITRSRKAEGVELIEFSTKERSGRVW